MVDARPALRRCFDERDRARLVAIAAAALPGGAVRPAAGPGAVAQVEHFVAGLGAPMQRLYRTLLAALDASARLHTLRPLAALPEPRRLEILERWRRGDPARRFALRYLLSPLKVAHFGHPAWFDAVGCQREFAPPATIEQPRYVRERVQRGADLDADLELDCDVVVVGSGAGGAVVARELAERGHAVVLLEEGAYFDRRDFTGRAFEMQRKMYRSAGATFTVGNAAIPIPLGRTVGGTTTINSGTCYRVPARVLAKWRDQLGLTELTEAHLDPYYRRVEEVLGVAPAASDHLGGAARVIARGCDRLGWRHGPLDRNAPDCDGKGVCCFGCPTDAKRSTNVSYVPLALRAGAQLWHGVRVDRLALSGDRVVGVVGHAVDRRGRSITPRRTVSVRAAAVVLACGAIHTPLLLLRGGLANRSGQLGRNLSIHPAVAVMARFGESIAGFNAIPQGYAIEEFRDQGILFEGASTPLDVGMAATTLIGPPLIELAEAFDHIAMFGFLVEDHSRGRVRLVRGRPLLTYRLERRDVARLQRGVELLARVFLAAGAERVLPPVAGFDALLDAADLDRFRVARLRATDFDISAYHPLGTARMGPDPRSSVVGPDHQSHDLRGLYIADGSALPSSLAVNPQLTIMAMATRAAEHIDRALARTG